LFKGPVEIFLELSQDHESQITKSRVHMFEVELQHSASKFGGVGSALSQEFGANPQLATKANLDEIR